MDFLRALRFPRGENTQIQGNKIQHEEHEGHEDDAFMVRLSAIV